MGQDRTWAALVHGRCVAVSGPSKRRGCARVSSINGFLYDDEADLLLAATARVLAMPGPPRSVVEIGSYCGKSTVVFGMTARVLHPDAKVYAIDPHQGELSVADEIVPGEPTFKQFQRNMAAAGLEQVVVPIKQRSTDVRWNLPIGLLFVDGLHDYLSVSRDFAHFAPWVVPGGLVAFHDYGKRDFPGVTSFVDEAVARGGYLLVQRASGLVVLEKLDTRRRVLGVPLSRSVAVTPLRLSLRRSRATIE